VLADMIQLHWRTGMRPGEVVAMKALELTAHGDALLYQPAWHKNAWRKKSAPRVIPLGPVGRGIVAKYVTASTKPAEPMFRRPDGAAYTTASYRRAVRAACKAADVPVWTPNQIRHSYTTRVRERFGELAVQAMLGHANINQQKVYGEAAVRRAIEVAREVG
jgi:integrase